jgi:hypothetical protein
VLVAVFARCDALTVQELAGDGASATIGAAHLVRDHQVVMQLRGTGTSVVVRNRVATMPHSTSI